MIEETAIETTEEKKENNIEAETCLTSLKNTLFNEQNEQITYTVCIYALGDAIWSALSYLNVGMNLEKTNDTDFDSQSQWAGQQLYSTIAMGLLGIALACWYGSKKAYAKSTDVIATTVAGSLSLYTWDRAQSFGIAYFKHIGYSDDHAGYLSSLFTGLAEAITQFLFLKIVKLLTHDKEYLFLKNKFKVYSAHLGCETALNLSIGLIPGAVWQLVYNAAVIYFFGAMGTGLSVAISVALSNIFTMKCIQTITKSESYKKCLKMDASEETQTDETAPCIQCLSWFNHPEKPETQTATEASILLPLN